MKFAPNVNPAIIATKDIARQGQIHAWVEASGDKALYCATDGHMGIVAEASLDPTDHLPPNRPSGVPARVKIPKDAAKAAARAGELGVNGAISAGAAQWAHVDNPDDPKRCEPPPLAGLVQDAKSKAQKEGRTVCVDSGYLAKLLDAMGAKEKRHILLTFPADEFNPVIIERQDGDGTPMVTGALMPCRR